MNEANKQQVIDSLVDKYVRYATSSTRQHIEAERYKFDALRHFRDTFDIDAGDIASNIKDSLSKIGNLAVGMGYYPVASICDIAKNEPETVRNALRVLFSTDQPEVGRIIDFQKTMAPLSQQYSTKAVSYPYNMDLRFISLLLSLRHPKSFMYFKATQVDAIYKEVYGEKTGTSSGDVNRLIKARELGKELMSSFTGRWPEEFRTISAAMSMENDDNLWFAQDIIWYNATRANTNSLLDKIRQFMNDNPDWRNNSHWTLTQSQIDTAVAEFQEKFSPEKLQAMSDDEILRWIPYRETTTNDGLSYLLEHSPIVGKMGGIGGGSAGKMGYYQGKDSAWKTNRDRATSQEDVLNHRKIDIDVLVAMYKHISSDDYTGLREYINGLKNTISEDGNYTANVPGLVWVRKYFTVLFPDKFVELYSGTYVKKLEDVAAIGKINGDGKDPDYSLWYRQMSKIAKHAPELGITNYELSRIIWDLVNEESKEEETMNEDIADQMETISLNTIIYGPPGTGKTYSIGGYKNQLLANQQSRFENLIKGSVKDTLLFLFAQNDNTPQASSDIWRSEQFQKLQEYNGRTRSNEAAVYNELVYNNKSLFHRVEEDRIKYYASQEGLDYIQSVIESQAEETAPSTDDFYQFITFHQSYGYEEFIEGIRAETDDNGSIHYAVRDGVFKSFCRRAESDPGNNYLFVIDEINRANISKVFGELITLLEPTKRLGAPEELITTLPYSGEKFGIPKNVHIIGTMNTADRSIALLDIALRRRFDFVELMPRPELLAADVDGVSLQKLLSAINLKIVKEIDRNHQIGHSYFMGINSLSELHRVWYQRIVPLLQEYFYDNNDDLRTILKVFVSNDEVVVLQSEEFRQALIGIYEETQRTDPGIQ